MSWGAAAPGVIESSRSLVWIANVFASDCQGIRLHNHICSREAEDELRVLESEHARRLWVEREGHVGIPPLRRRGGGERLLRR